MPRVTDVNDETIHAGFGPSKDKQYRAKEGEEHIVRIVTKMSEFMIHAVDDVLPPKKNGEPGVFNMSCAQDWSEKDGEWVGECRGHERDYDCKPRYVCGMFLLAIKRGKSIFPLEPADSARYWDFAKGTVLDLRKVEKGADKPLKNVDVLISLKDEAGAEEYQKLVVTEYKGEKKVPITAAHLEVFKASIPALMAEVAAPSTLEEQDRRLKPKKKGAPAAAAASSEPEVGTDDLDLDLDGGGKKAAPAAAPAKRRAAAPAAKAPVEEEPAADEELPEAEEAPAPPPKAAAKKPAAAPAKAPVAATKKTTQDAEVDDMLEGLESAE